MSSTSELLPLPLTPVTAVSVPSGNLDVDVLEVVVPGAEDLEEGGRGSGEGGVASMTCLPPFRTPAFHPPLLRHADRLLAAEVRAGDAAALARDFVRRARGDDLAAEPAGAGAEVEQAVGVGDHFAVVLDDEQRVAEVAELLQRRDEPRVVARVEADRRFVEHVEHAAQAAADLAGEANALGFAAGERRRGPAEREVIRGRRRPGT